MSKPCKIMVLAVVSLTVTISGCVSKPTRPTQEAFVKRYGSFNYCRLKVTKQSKSYSCGTACLVSVLKYWGYYTTEELLFAKYPASLEGGYSLHDLHGIALAEGLETYMLKLDNPKVQLKEQLQKGRPVICAITIPGGLYTFYDWPFSFGPLYKNLLWLISPRQSHFVIAFGQTEDEILLMDPAYGYVSQSWERFLQCWSSTDFSVLLCVYRSGLDVPYVKPSCQ